jgi:hypothetical protein
MLTKLATALLVGVGLTVAIPTTASAAGCGDVCGAARGIVVIPGSTTPGNPGSNNPGSTGPNLGCPTVGIGTQCTQGLVAPAAPQPVPPAELATEAEDALPLGQPKLNWAPAPRTYVALETSLWLTPGSFAKVSAPSPPVRGVVETVLATATPVNVIWNLGTKTITCHNGGTPGEMSCNYTYPRSSADQPNGKYHITATITWTIAVVCTGDCPGGLNPDGGVKTKTGAADLAVGEIQTESTPG